MNKPHRIGIFGTGDFLRWQSPELLSSKTVSVAAVYDPDTARAEKWAATLGASSAKSEDEIFGNPMIDIVLLFVPPWIRRPLIEKAALAGKHILATKPLGASIEDCNHVISAVGDRVRAGVIYGRTQDAHVEVLKDILEGGTFGKLALHRQDWIHAYPQWNSWATDPEKNGGPFMDAMIHNMNTCHYLMGREASQAVLFSDNLAHPNLKCADTESLKIDFGPGRTALLFITWAADLATHGTDGNDREHIDVCYFVTDKGWRLTRESKDGKPFIRASREGVDEWIEVNPPSATIYDGFTAAIDAGTPLPRSLASLADAARDIRIIRNLGRTPGQVHPL
jgi:predicted dehydrogenase